MKVLIIPDIHNKQDRAMEIAAREPEVNEVVCLGDYLDNFYDDWTHAYDMGRWMREILRGFPNWTLLVGNHDAHYIWPSNRTMCSGWTKEKAMAFWDGFQYRKLINHMRFFKTVGKFVLSHAGFHPSFADEYDKGHEDIINDELLKSMREERPRKLVTNVSRARGGSNLYPGLLWMDWDELEPIPGMNQIVGHTPGKEIRYKSSIRAYSRGMDSHNWCLDTHLKHYVIIDTEKPTETAVEVKTI